MDSLSVHAALALPELQALYISFLPMERLPTAALVCKFWLDLVLELLWSFGEVPFGALAERLVHEAEAAAVKSQGHPPTVTSTTRPALYFRKVTRIHLKTWDANHYFQLLHKYAIVIEKSLWPNLQSLRISADVRDDMAIIPSVTRLLTPSLTEFTITPYHAIVDPNHHSFPLRTLLHLLVANAPRTTQLKLAASTNCGICTLIDGSRILPDMFGLFAHLRVLHLQDFHIQGWYKLADCKGLEEVVVLTKSSVVESRNVSHDRDMYPITFPALKKLVYRYAMYGTHILVNTIMPSLRDVDVFATYDAPNQGRVLSLLAQRSPLLDTVKLKFQMGLMEDSTLVDLSTLSNIRSLSLSNWHKDDSVSFTDGSVELLAEGLPTLQSLTIRMAEDDRSRHSKLIRITGRSILALARHCRALKTLLIPVDLSDCLDSSSLSHLTASDSITHLTLRPLVLRGKPAQGAVRLVGKCMPALQSLVVFELGGDADPTGSFIRRFRKYRANVDATVEIE